MKHVAIIMVLTFLGCSKNDKDLVDSSNLNGQWIETQLRLDTLSFDFSDSLKIMNLKRGKELKDGYLLPKPKSGSYTYQLSV